VLLLSLISCSQFRALFDSLIQIHVTVWEAKSCTFCHPSSVVPTSIHAAIMSSASFAAAQERVNARHTARDAQLRSQFHARQSFIQNSPLSRLPYPFSHIASPLSTLWLTLSGREGTRPAFRVGQVDAELLDEELLELLKGQVGEALKYYGPHIRDDWAHEILLILRAVLFKLSIWDHDASYGASLQNLRYADARVKNSSFALPTKWQKGLYGLFTVLGRYGWEKWENWLVDQEGGYAAPSDTVQQLSRLTAWASTTHSITAFASFLVFLVNGRYRTLTDRLLRLRLTLPTSQVSREVSFEYLNRQLVWHAFTEFLLFLLPLVGISRWRRWLSRAWRKAKTALNSSVEDEDAGLVEKSGPLAFLPERTCAICYQDQNPASTSEAEILGANAASGGGGVIGSATTDVVNPYETLPCGCIYCFVCVATKLEAEEGEGWSCLRCGEIIKKCRPWHGDVVLERKHSANASKSVGFAEAKGDLAGKLDDVEPIPEEEVPQSLEGDFSQWTSAKEGDAMNFSSKANHDELTP
jgi:peroxin-2